MKNMLAFLRPKSVAKQPVIEQPRMSFKEATSMTKNLEQVELTCVSLTIVPWIIEGYLIFLKLCVLKRNDVNNVCVCVLFEERSANCKGKSLGRRMWTSGAGLGTLLFSHHLYIHICV